MKGFVHQIYCTHCTYGTSAVEQRQGDMADRVLGYGARASSLETADLRKHYREIERFLYYTLSVDSPSDEKKRLTAETAPRRLVYCPAIGGVKMLGQMSYRQTDTAGRPGSYFGHVLIADRAESWSVLDCLQTWGAPWCDQDSPALQFKLPTLPSVKAVHASSRPSIDDAVLLSFLKTPAGGAFDDPHGLIPPRWRAAPQHERLELLADSLRAFLHLAVDRRESLLLVVEPSVATLIFYGIARLLPPGSLRDELSFSTFEHNTDRLPVTLAATTFYAPETSDLKPDAYRGRGYVYNTYLKKGSTAPRTPSQYAALMVDTLATEGIAAVDAMHVDFSVAAPKKSEDLELLAQARNKVTALLAPSSPAVNWKDGVEADFLASSIRRELAFADANSPVLAGVVGSANHLAVLELIATNTDVGTREAVRHLSLTLPSRMLSAFVDSQRIADDAKLAPVLEHIRKHKNFPPNCESLWSRPAAPGRQRPAAGVQGGLLPKILEQVSAAELAPLYEHVPLNGRIAYLTSLLVVCRNDSSKAPVLDKLIEAVDEDAFAHLLETHAEDLRRNFSRKDPIFGKRLNQALFGLVHSPRQFLHRLDLLAKWLEYFPDIVNTEHRLENWRKVYRTFETVKNSAPKANAGLLEKLTGGGYELDEDRLGWSLAESMKVAMPSAYCDDPDGSLKIGFLKEFGAIMLGSSTFLGPEVWRRIDYFYESGQWSAPISNRGGAGFQKAGGLMSPRNLMIGGAAAVVVVVLLIMLRPAGSTSDLASKPTNHSSAPDPAASTTNPPSAKQTTTPPPSAGVRTTDSMSPAIQTSTPATSTPASTAPSFTDPPKTVPEAQPASTPTPQTSATASAQTPSNEDMPPPAAATATQTPQIASTNPQPMPSASATAPAVASATGGPTGTPAATAQPAASMPQQVASAAGSKPLPSLVDDKNVANSEGKPKSMPYSEEKRFQFKSLPAISDKTIVVLSTIDAGNDSSLRLIQPNSVTKRGHLKPTDSNISGQLLVFSDFAGTPSSATSDPAQMPSFNSFAQLARFSVVNGSLTFQWKEASTKSEHRQSLLDLSECVLEVKPKNSGRIFMALCDPLIPNAASVSECASQDFFASKDGKDVVLQKLPPLSRLATVIADTNHRQLQPDELFLGSMVGRKNDEEVYAFLRTTPLALSAKTTGPVLLVLKTPKTDGWVKQNTKAISVRMEKPPTDKDGQFTFDVLIELKQPEIEKDLGLYRSRVDGLRRAKQLLINNPDLLNKEIVVIDLIKNNADAYNGRWKKPIEEMASAVGIVEKSSFSKSTDAEAFKKSAQDWYDGLKRNLFDPITDDKEENSVDNRNKRMLADIKKRQLILCHNLNEVSSVSMIIYRRVADFEVPEVVVGTVPAILLNSNNIWVEKQ